MPWIASLDWTDLNSLRRYPLREGTSAMSVDEQFSIPDTLIVDFTLTANSDVARRFYISRVFNKLSSVVIEISDNFDNAVGVIEAVKATHTRDKDYYITPTNAFVGSGGRMTLGSLEDLLTQPAGDFSFSLTATELEPRTIIPGIQGVDRIEFIDSRNGSYLVTGDVKLTARNNLNFSYSDSSAFNRVFLDVGDGLGLNKVCATSNPIKSINGVLPDALGNISLLGVSCLKVLSTTPYTLDLEDTCCTPCSGCDDLEELTTRLTTLENKYLDLKGNYNSVNAHLTTYLSTINSNCSCPA